MKPMRTELLWESEESFVFVKTEKEQATAKACMSRAPSLAETEEALAQAVWCWAGVSRSVLVHNVVRLNIKVIICSLSFFYFFYS